MKTILVVGKTGQLAQCIHNLNKEAEGYLFIFRDSKELDVTNIKSVESVFDNISNVDYCINCSGYTFVDKAESEKTESEKVNSLGPKNLALICKKYDVVLIHISTDFVFDGTSKIPYTETEITHPLNVYGLSKLKGEQEIVNNTNKYYIIRTSWLYSEYGSNFLKTILKLAKQKNEISVVNDQIGSPTYAKDLAKVIVRLIKSDNIDYGIYNYSNQGYTSWFGFAKAIVKISKLKIDLSPISSNEYKTKAIRPKFSVLDTSKIANTMNLHIPNWENSLLEAIKNMRD